MCFFVQTNHTRKELLFLMFKEINLRNHSSLHKLFYSLRKLIADILTIMGSITSLTEIYMIFLMYIRARWCWALAN